MTSTSNQFEVNDDSKVAGVSRSGRVRKKSSKLMYFDSTSENIKNKKSSKSSQPSKSSKKKKSSNIENVDVHNQSRHTKDDQVTNKPQKKNAKRVDDDSMNLSSLKKMKIESPKTIPLNDASANANVEKQCVQQTKESLQYNSTTNSDSETYSALSNNEIETPDYTSYDEESVNSDEDLLLPKKVITPGLNLHPTTMLVNDAIPAATQQFVYTGYRLWSSEMKREIMRKYPAIDINVLNVRLGEMWTRLSTMERNNWHARARAVAQKNGSQNECVMDYKTQAWLNSCVSHSSSFGQSVNDVKLRNIELEPIDVAAHLRLLGESMMLIGSQFQKRKRPVVTSDCITALLDSLLCAMGSLVCLTQQVPLIKTDKDTIFKRTLENIAYIMPGL